jgi:lysophospholipase L1-like esterase
VPPLTDLAISLYLPVATSGTTFHNVASQTNHIAPAGGDYTSAVVMPTEATALNYFFLSGVTVKASERAQAVVALGDSITDGTRSTPDTNNRWPNTLARRLMEDRRTDHIAVLNEGISGNRILSAGSGPNMLSRFDRDVLAKRAVKYIVLLIGINDIGNSARGTGPLVTADDIIAGYRQLIARARQNDIRIYAGTLTPIAGSGYDFPAAEAMRQSVNHWIRTSGAFDAVIDFDAVTRDPADPTRFLPAYDSGDHLHPNDAGYAAMGRAIPLTLFRH